MTADMTPRALVLRAPGINCDRETAHACRVAGFETELAHINRLIQEPARLLDYHLLVIPGGFSYGDDLGAGTLLAKNLEIHLGEQLRRFIDEGRLVLGICNGFQALVRAGLLPGTTTQPVPPVVGTRFIASSSASVSQASLPGRDESRPYDGWVGRMLTENGQMAATLTDNASARFECRWVALATQDSPCIFTRGIDHAIELPVAHGEGQFALADPALLEQLQASKRIPIVYTITAWQASRKSPSPATPPFALPAADVLYPDNPNGSVGNIAGICNERGNVFGLMPHPERYIQALQHPQRRGQAGLGDGLLIFRNAYTYVHDTFCRDAYAVSGVNIAAADAAKTFMRAAVQASQGSEVLVGLGAFAGVFDLSALKEMRRPALVASTDGVGTKTLIAAQAGRYDTIGYDLVNHSVNDLLTQGARPLFFMDYLAMGKLDAQQAAEIVRGVANACREIGCALLGGETAEMPGVYLPGAFDLAGTIVGVIDWDAAHTTAMQPGDALLGLPSSGLHTNGYSLARRIFAPYAPETVFPELGEPLVDALLRPHRGYLREMTMLRERLGAGLKGAAHITGGGFEGNISRILPEGIQAIIDRHAWDAPPLFGLMQRLGHISQNEMYRAFNMGVGMTLVFAPDAAREARRLLPELIPVGYLVEGTGVVLS